MSKRLLENPYRGVNAHLHSIAQNPDRSASVWTSFHASHIGHITDALNALLPANYLARSEQSLQIWTEEMETGDTTAFRPRPDSVIFQSGGAVPTTSAAAVADPSVRVISLKTWLTQEEFFFSSVVIYPIDAHDIIGQPVTRIELLSASNKRGGAGAGAYQHNRLTALKSGNSLVELDYLHQTLSPLPGIPHYPNDFDSHAYSLAVTDRRPGQNPDDNMLMYLFDVDMPIATQCFVPLAGSESLIVNFDAIYQHTFTVGRWGLHVDYDQPPKQMSTYSASDQAHITQVMARIVEGS